MKDYFLTHPDNVRLMRDVVTIGDTGSMAVTRRIAGVRLETSPFVHRWVRKWQAPKERFIEHEAGDEPWLRYFGIGHEVDTNEPAIWLIKAQAFDFLENIRFVPRQDDILTRTGRRAIFGSLP